MLHTPTLVYVFLAGAMISFGTNGIVGWGPTFVARELELSPAEARGAAGEVGADRGHRRERCSAGSWPTGSGAATRPAG